MHVTYQQRGSSLMEGVQKVKYIMLGDVFAHRGTDSREFDCQRFRGVLVEKTREPSEQLSCRLLLSHVGQHLNRTSAFIPVCMCVTSVLANMSFREQCKRLCMHVE